MIRQVLSLIAVVGGLTSCAPSDPPANSRPVRSLAELMANIPPGGTPNKVAYASIDLSCGGKTYTVKTGTEGGSCSVTTYSNPKNNVAICSDGSKGGGGANCTDGCVSSEGAGSCSNKTSH